MKLLLTALLLLSTPLLAQTPRGQTARKYNCDADHYALGRPTTEEIQRRFGTKTVPAVEYHACKSADTVKVASEGGAIDDMEINQQFVTTFLALTSRIEALEEHLASETARIDGNLQRLNDKLSTVNVRPAYVQPAQQYTPPTVTVPNYNAPQPGIKSIESTEGKMK